MKEMLSGLAFRHHSTTTSTTPVHAGSFLPVKTSMYVTLVSMYVSFKVSLRKRDELSL